MSKRTRLNAAARSYAPKCGALDNCALCRCAGATRTLGREPTWHIREGTDRRWPVRGKTYLSPPKRGQLLFSAGDVSALAILEVLVYAHLPSDAGVQ